MMLVDSPVGIQEENPVSSAFEGIIVVLMRAIALPSRTLSFGQKQNRCCMSLLKNILKQPWLVSVSQPDQTGLLAGFRRGLDTFQLVVQLNTSLAQLGDLFKTKLGWFNVFFCQGYPSQIRQSWYTMRRAKWKIYGGRLERIVDCTHVIQYQKVYIKTI